MENHVSAPALSLLRRPSRHLLSRQLQDRLDGGAPGNVDQFVAGPLALLDQIDHGQQQLPVPGEKLGQLLFIGLSLLVDRVVAFLHGGSSFQGLATRFFIKNQVEPPLNFQLRSGHPRSLMALLQLAHTGEAEHCVALSADGRIGRLCLLASANSLNRCNASVYAPRAFWSPTSLSRWS